ncbi:MAG: SUMF1/EgtB/PvdO family nonheme iron enzyme [Planctomycetes bacterium]|nr:SUMF1/EgtB/PvdO family nonheme iron enzyme [Planctomycetota bacterium]
MRTSPAGKFIYQDGQEIDVPAFYIGKYEVTKAEYAEFVAWLKKEAEKGQEGDPHRFCYPGYLQDGKELSDQQLEGLRKLTVEKRAAAIEKMGLQGGETGGRGTKRAGARRTIRW